VNRVTRNEIRAAIRDILADLVDDDSLQINDDTTAADVPDWDSINHVRLMLTLEKRFGFRFRSDATEGLDNVSALIDVVERRLGG
jgi:acyl carrier protein